MTRQQVTDAVFNAVGRAAGFEVDADDAMRYLGIDSLDKVEIGMEVEKTLGCGDLTDIFEDVGCDTTVEEIIDAICNQLDI